MIIEIINLCFWIIGIKDVEKVLEIIFIIYEIVC